MTNTLRFVAALAAAAVATTAQAGTPEKRFTHNGVTYIYTSTAQDGRTVLDGHILNSRKAFRLIVSDGRVSGTASGAPVDFAVADARGAAGPAIVQAD